MLKGASALENKREQEKKFDPNLRSLERISKYEIHNHTGLVGRLKDVIVNMNDWSIPYLLMDDLFTSDQERVLVEVSKIVSIDWDTNRITVSLQEEELKNATRINAGGFFSDGSDLFRESQIGSL
jgi:sporulation protein YlmC with PRC-barrel domain